MKKALLVIDLQNDYFENGKMQLDNTNLALENSNKLIKYASANDYKIFVIQHIGKESSSFFVPNTIGVEVHKDLDVKNTDSKLIIKNYPNSFKDTILLDELKKENINELLVCGAMTHMCIDSTVRAGFDLGFKITLAYDACATKDLEINGKIVKSNEVHNSFMSALAYIFCEVTNTNEIIKK